MSVHVLFALEEFEEGTARKVELEGHQISLVRIDDDVYAIGDICSHEDVSLSEGYVDAEECLLECWRHGAMFNLKTGEPETLPAIRPVPVYEASVVDGMVQIAIEQGAAPPAAGRGEALMSELVIEGLRARVGGQEILKGVDLTMASGEVHAVMGPNGSGKSTLAHALAGRPGLEVLGGSARLDGIELLDLPAWERAQAGLFFTMQYPTEVPGVALRDLLRASVRTSDNADEIESLMRAEAKRIGFDEKFLERPLNVDLSGGEKKRNETLQLGVLRPRFAILDELDSGLDFDALRLVGSRVEAATEEDAVGVLAITHYSRVFEQLRPDTVHVFAGGRIQQTVGEELAQELEDTGYERWSDSPPTTTSAAKLPEDPFADPFA